MDYATMEAGQEMDALVATEIFKFRFEGGVWYYPPYKYGIFTLSPYSTDIAAAWEVVEKLKDMFFRTSIHTWDYGQTWCPERAYLVSFMPRQGHDEDLKDIEGWGDTPSLAICRAALMAQKEG